MTAYSTPSPENGPLDLRDGQTLGDFTLRRRIGSGAMADVWLAVERSLDRVVALKILRPGGDAGSVERFLREAKTAARLDHPNIVRIYKVGVFDTLGRRSLADKILLRPLENREPLHYIAEEYIPGLNLRQWLGSHGPLSFEQTLSILGQVATALKVASAAGIVHRDIKPENILLGPTGRIKVVDFGLAVGARTPSDLSLTQIGVTLGTPLYMSPEQAESRELDVRSDIYSLGVTAYQTLTGKVPFTGSTPFAVLLAHRSASFEPIRSRRPDTPVALERLIDRMLAKDPDDRFASADALLDAVRTVRAELAAPSSTGDAIGAQKTEGTGKSKEIETTADAESADDLFPPFEPDESERAAFQSRLDALESSRLLQTRFTVLDDMKKSRSPLDHSAAGRSRLIFRLAAALILCAVAGVGVGLLARQAFFGPPPTKIQRFATVEEQWVFAAQVGTGAAWKSVIDYFPRESYWTSRAERQLARAYLLEGQTAEARRLFERMHASSDPTVVAFAQAGMAYCMAVDGFPDQAAALISRLRSGPVKTYDRLTEDILSQALLLIRKRAGS